MYFDTILYSLMIEIIVTKVQIKNINVRMLSKCVDECGNYKFAICYPRGACHQRFLLESMLNRGRCLYSISSEYKATASGSEFIDHVSFNRESIDKSISDLDKMMLMVTKDVDAPAVFLCEESRINTTNGMKIKFIDAYGFDNKMRFEILIEAVCENAACYGQTCDICATTTDLLPTTDTTYLPMQTTKSTGHTGDTTSLTTIEAEKIAESTTHGNTTINVRTTTHQTSSATTTELLPTTDMSTSRETTTHLPTQTTYFTGDSGHTTNRPSPTKQSVKFTESTTRRNTKSDVESTSHISTSTKISTEHSRHTTNLPTKQKLTESPTHSNIKTDVASTSRLSTSTKILSAKTTNNATTPAISKNNTSQEFTTSSKGRSSTTLGKTTPFIKYIDSTIPSSRTITGPTTVKYSSTNKSLSNPANINEEVENSTNVSAWVITTTAVGIVVIIIVLLIVYIRWLKIQKRTTSSSQEFISHL